MDKKITELVKKVGNSTILIAPLDWGLGHATRCIPVINELLSQEHKVIIAASGPVEILLKQEFPDIEYLPLKGYNINYSHTRFGLVVKLLLQIPKILYAISSEKKWLRKLLDKRKIDIVISDNRYGFYNKKIYSIFITHQLLIKTPLFKILVQKINYQFINRFDECWVPDFKDQPNLAGELSHPKRLPSIPVSYVGWLSRFTKTEEKAPKHLLILLSGPEPQRTLLEKKILAQLENFSDPVLIVRGLPGAASTISVRPNVNYINHLPAKELQTAIIQSSFVIARSGYSTLMDLMKLQKKTILIPTPGQMEQEYLAKYLLQKKAALTTTQEKFNLERLLLEAYNFPYLFYACNATELLKRAVTFEQYKRKP